VNVAGYAPSTPSSSSAASLYQGCSNGSHGGAVEDDGARNARAELVSTHGVYDGMPCSTARRSSYGARTVYSAHRRHRDLPALLIPPALRPRNWEPQSSTSIETAAGGVESASGARPSIAYPCRLVSSQQNLRAEYGVPGRMAHACLAESPPDVPRRDPPCSPIAIVTSAALTADATLQRMHRIVGATSGRSRHALHVRAYATVPRAACSTRPPRAKCLSRNRFEV
jgi:hypothetical protein